jgi:hypothetical protein
MSLNRHGEHGEGCAKTIPTIEEEIHADSDVVAVLFPVCDVRVRAHFNLALDSRALIDGERQHLPRLLLQFPVRGSLQLPRFQRESIAWTEAIRPVADFN